MEKILKTKDLRKSLKIFETKLKKCLIFQTIGKKIKNLLKFDKKKTIKNFEGILQRELKVESLKNQKSLKIDVINKQDCIKNQLLRMRHGRTQSEFPSNLLLYDPDYFGTNKKLKISKFESPFSENEQNSSDDVLSENEEDCNSNSNGTDFSKIDSKNQQIMKQNSFLKKQNIESIKSSSKKDHYISSKWKSIKVDSKMEENSLISDNLDKVTNNSIRNQVFKDIEKPIINDNSKKSQLNSEQKKYQFEGKSTFWEKNNNNKAVQKECTTKFITNQSEDKIYSQNTEKSILFFNPNVIQTHIGQLKIFSKNKNKKETKMITLENFAQGNQIAFSTPELDSFSKKKDLWLENHEQKNKLENSFSHENVIEEKNIQQKFFKKDTCHQIEPLIIDKKLPEKIQSQSMREIIDINKHLFEKTHTHLSKKSDFFEFRQSVGLNACNRGSIKVIASIPAHLDSIRKFEFVKNKADELFIISFSDDCLIKSRKININEETTSENKQNSNVDLNYMSVQSEIKTNQFLDMETKKYQEVYSRRKIESQFNSSIHQNLYQNLSKPPNISIKKVENLRVHLAPIFSTFASKSTDGPTRIFSGDSTGQVHTFLLENDKMIKHKSFKTGSEPCWGLTFFEDDLLVTSSPNKIKIFSLSTSPEKKEKFMYTNNKSFFGQIKSYNSSSFLVNSYSSCTLKNEFVLFDLMNQKESMRIHSTRAFSNSFVHVQTGNLLFSANEDKTVSIYDMREGVESHHFCAHSESVSSIDVCFDKNKIVTGGTDSSVRLWDLRTLRIYNEVHVHRKKLGDSIFDVKFDPSGTFIGSSGADGVLKIFHF